MKKQFKILGVAGLMSVLAFGAITLTAKSNSLVSAKADPVTEITVDESFFVKHKALDAENWSEGFDANAGYIIDNANQTYWNEGYSYQAMGKFFDGCSWGEGGREGWTGRLLSQSWTQSTQYIYFTWGCANDSNRGSGAAVKLIMHVQHGEDTFAWDVYNDTFSGIAMVYRYFEIPSATFDTFNGEDFTMWIEFYDGRGTDYGAHTFGWLHVNQTWEGVMSGARTYYDALRTPMQENIYNHFRGNLPLICALDDVLTEDFETQAGFESNFSYDNDYGNKDWMDGRHPGSVIATSDCRGEGTNMPYNKTDNGLFRGWYDDGVGGYVASDVPTYRFVSRPFVLKGTGLVSIKMGGRGASFHVLDFVTGDELAFIDVDAADRTHKAFKTNTGVENEQKNIALSGFNTVTMVRHYINLDQYLGRVLRVAIADVHDSNWAAAYFDELVTRYTTYPQFKVDSVAQTVDEKTTYSHYQDIFVNSTSYAHDKNGILYTGSSINAHMNAAENWHVDESAAKKAYDLLVYYYDTFRTAGTGFSRCDVNATELLSRYNALSEEAKAIVNAAQDFDCSNKGAGQQWYDNDIVRKDEHNVDLTVGRAINDFANKAANGGGANYLFGMKVSEDTTTVTIVLVSVFCFISLLAFAMMAKKRKQTNK